MGKRERGGGRWREGERESGQEGGRVVGLKARLMAQPTAEW